MPKWRNEYRRCDNCRREYRPQRETQSYCSRACRRQAAYGRERFKAATVGRRERRLEASDKLSGILVRRKTTNHAHRCVPHSRRILDNRAPLWRYQGLLCRFECPQRHDVVRRKAAPFPVAACQRLHVGQPSPQWSISTNGYLILLWLLKCGCGV